MQLQKLKLNSAELIARENLYSPFHRLQNADHWFPPPIRIEIEGFPNGLENLEK